MVDVLDQLIDILSDINGNMNFISLICDEINYKDRQISFKWSIPEMLRTLGIEVLCLELFFCLP